MSNEQIPDLGRIRQAESRIARFIHRTPVLTCNALDGMFGGRLFFKCENLQKTGSFKIRGATNAVLSLADETAKNGVASHSSGNHAAALALAARNRGIPAHLVMPENAPALKIRAVEGYGGLIRFCEPTLEARESMLADLVDEKQLHFIHPYNDFRIISGQATVALELLKDVPDLDLILCPVGGGGLTSGIALATRYVSPKTQVIATEPSLVDDAYRSVLAGKIIPVDNAPTMADGLKTSLGDKTFPIIRQYVNAIVTVTEESISAAMRTIWERMKLVVEPSAAVPLAAIVEGKIDTSGKKIGIVLSGGNVDLDVLPWQRRDQEG